jgi:hypothetical protein
MHTFIEEVAAAYAMAPVNDPTAHKAWRVLADETMALARRLEGCLDVRYTPVPEPYPTAHDMLVDIARGCMVVSTANSDHPIWTLEENCAFRLVHDVLGHGTTGSGFDWRGEWVAYEKHCSVVQSPAAKWALFTEAVGQVAYAIVNRGFTSVHVQKVAFLPQWMQWDYPVREAA